LIHNPQDITRHDKGEKRNLDGIRTGDRAVTTGNRSKAGRVLTAVYCPRKVRDKMAYLAMVKLKRERPKRGAEHLGHETKRKKNKGWRAGGKGLPFELKNLSKEKNVNPQRDWSRPWE